MEWHLEDSESGISSCASSFGNNFYGLGSGRKNSHACGEEFDISDIISLNSDPDLANCFDISSNLNDICHFPPVDRNFTSQEKKKCESETYTPFTCEKHKCKLCLECLNCNSFICKDCTLTDHWDCNFKPLVSYVKEICDSAVEEDVFDFEKRRESIINIQKAFQSKVKLIKKEVDNLSEQILEDLRDKRKNIFYKLDVVEKLKVDSWRRQIELCDIVLHKLFTYQAESKILDFKDINALRKNIAATVGNTFDFIEDDNVSVSGGFMPNYNLGLIKSSPSPRNSNIIFPEYSYVNKFNICTMIVRDHMNENVKDGDYYVSAAIHNTQNIPIYLIIENMKNGIFKIKYYPTTEGKCFLNVFLNFFPICDGPYELNVISDTKVKSSPVVIKNSEGDEEFYRPWGVCSDDKGRIFVVDRGHHCVKVFKDNGEFLWRFGEEGAQPGNFFRPAGIAVDEKLGRIVVADKDNHRVQVFTSEGSYIFHFGRLGNENGHFCYPWDVSVNSISQIAVSDSKNHRIQLFNEKGDFIHKFCFNVKLTKQQTDLPRGLAFCHDGSLMITDFNKHKIILLNVSFEIARKFGREGAEIGQFTRPQGIAIDRNGRFAVADCRNHRVQIFESDGRLCAVLGGEGNQPGEMDLPQGITFLSDGRIVVAERGNNRVQILKI